MASLPFPDVSTTTTATANSTSSSVPSASSSAASGGSTDSAPTTTSATLYLYTFLATLVLLLSVSAAIVVRSYLVRRRQRQLIDAAIRDGLISGAPAPGVSLERAALLARKPQLFDVYLGHAPAEKARGERTHRSGASTSSAGSVGGGWWNAVMPVSAKEVNVAPSVASKPRSLPPSTHPSPTSRSTFSRLRQQLRVIMPTPFVAASILPAPATARIRQPETVELSPSSVTTSAPSVRPLDVAFLVAMPAPHEASHHYEQGYLPYVEFGLARVQSAQESGADEQQAR